MQLLQGMGHPMGAFRQPGMQAGEIPIQYLPTRPDALQPPQHQWNSRSALAINDAPQAPQRSAGATHVQSLAASVSRGAETHAAFVSRGAEAALPAQAASLDGEAAEKEKLPEPVAAKPATAVEDMRARIAKARLAVLAERKQARVHNFTKHGCGNYRIPIQTSRGS